MKTSEQINNFLSYKNIAIAGVSRNPKSSVGNFIYKKFKDAGYNVFQINPNADEIEGEKCYRNLSSTPQKADGVFITTHPEKSLDVVKDCFENGITKVWFHRSIGNGSYSKEAEDFCKEKNIDAITYGCPMMYIKPVDFFHNCFKFFMKLGGKLS